jgi:Outer membrane lipoprotein carrier protein LolA-like
VSPARRAARRGAWLALACALVPAAIPAPAPAPPDAASDFNGIDALLQHFATRRTSHVTFTEVHRLAILDRPLQSSGELLYQAPDRLEKRILKPQPEVLRFEHGVLTAERGTHRRVLALADYPQLAPFVESLRAVLAGDRVALERYFTPRFSGSLASWTLELEPVDPAAARSVRSVRLAGEGDAIHTVEIRERDGDSSLLTLGPELSP